MNTRQQRFVQEYLIDLNATQAAVRAGYSKRSAVVHASRLLTKANIQAEIRTAMNRCAEKAEIDAAWVLKRLVEVAERCMKEETFDAAGANRALETIGKHLGMFTEKTEGKNTIEVRYLTDSADKPPDAGM